MTADLVLAWQLLSDLELLDNALCRVLLIKLDLLVEQVEVFDKVSALLNEHYEALLEVRQELVVDSLELGTQLPHDLLLLFRHQVISYFELVDAQLRNVKLVASNLLFLARHDSRRVSLATRKS